MSNEDLNDRNMQGSGRMEEISDRARLTAGLGKESGKLPPRQDF